MSHSARVAIMIFITALFAVFPFLVVSADGGKVGLVFQNFEPGLADLLSRQLSKRLNTNPKLNVELIDSFDLILLEYFDIDSTTLKQLKERQLRGLILCKYSVREEKKEMSIEVLNLDNLTRQSIGTVALDPEKADEWLPDVAKAIEDFFVPHQDLKVTFGIIVAPQLPSPADSLAVQFKHNLIDSLRKDSTFSNIELKFLVLDSVEQRDLSRQALEDYGQRNHAQLVVTGPIESNSQHALTYHPRLLILNFAPAQNAFYADDRILSGKTCHIKEFNWPALSLENFAGLGNFLKGYFLIQTKKYADAIELLKSLDTFAAYFHLATCYFQQGLILRQDQTMAGAEPDSAIFYWHRALSRTDSHWDSVCTNNNLGVAFQLRGQLDSALVYYLRANSDWSEIANNEDFIQISHNLGNSYLLKGQWNKALEIFQSTLSAMEQSTDSLNLAMTYESLGHIYQLIYQKNKAINYYQKALELRTRLGDEAGLANSLNFLGNAYQGNKDYQLAANCFRQSVALNLKIHHEPQLANAFDDLGQLFQDTNELDSALFYFQKSIETYSLLDDKEGLVQTLLHQASVYQKQRAFDQAISLYEKALEIIGNSNSNSLRAQIYDRLGDIYNHQDNLIPALDYYQQASELYEKAGNFEILALVLYNMGLIKLKQNGFAEGYQLLKKAISLDEEHGFNNLSEEQGFVEELEGILKKY